MEEAVAEAFRSRPRLVESAVGFISLDVSRGVDDPAVFSLTTCWLDLDSFKAWHGSEAHHQSHCGIPKGLRLDPAYTRIETLTPTCSEPSWSDHVANFVSEGDNFYSLEFDADGIVIEANWALADALKIDRSKLKGMPVDQLLVEGEGARLSRALAGVSADQMLLNFVDSAHLPFSVRAQLVGIGAVRRILAEPASGASGRECDTMLELNNDFARLNREHVRVQRELAQSRDELSRALKELQTSYWHLRKIQEVLPICMGCNRVKTDTASWQDVAEYLKSNSLFLSHGYCPECFAKVKAEAGL